MKTKTKNNNLNKKRFLCILLALILTISCAIGIIYPQSVNAATMYTVTFDLNSGGHNGGGPLSQSIESGSKITNPPYTSRGYANFVGWTISGSVVNLSTYTVTSNVTLTAKWEFTTYTVTFDKAGGTITSGNAVQTIEYSKDAIPPTVTRTGYTFAGWSGSYTNINSNRTITALWDEKYFTVTFNLAGGTVTSGDAVQTISTGNSAIPPTVTRAGYTFNGWSGSYTNVTANRTITAQWTENVTYCSVYFSISPAGYGGGGALVQSIPYGSKITNPPYMTIGGHEFMGWHNQHGDLITDLAAYVIVEETYLYAYWKPLTYTVTFDTAGGTVQSGSTTQSVKFGNDAVPPEVKRTGYNFIGWVGEYTNIYKDMTITAQWSTAYCTVYFSLGGAGHSGGGDTVQSIAYGSKITNPPYMTIGGHEFIGWRDSSANIINLDTYVVTGTLYLYADWKPLTYTVTFDTAGGTVTSGSTIQSVKFGNDATPPILTRTGYNFIGWVGTYTGINSDRTITAEWRIASYSVYFSLGGAGHSGGGDTVQSIAYGSKITNPPYMTIGGHEFVGWRDSSANIINLDTFIVVGETYLYADWKPLTYTVIFDAAGGTITSGSASQSVKFNNDATPPTVTRDGYYFVRWVGTYTGINSDRTITAVWIKENDVSVRIISAKITPADADNKLVDWTVSWANNATRKNEDVSQYIIITPSSSDGLTVIVTCLKEFEGDTIIITVTTRDGKYSAQCLVTYAVKENN